MRLIHWGGLGGGGSHTSISFIPSVFFQRFHLRPTGDIFPYPSLSLSLSLSRSVSLALSLSHPHSLAQYADLHGLVPEHRVWEILADLLQVYPHTHTVTAVSLLD